MSSIPRVVLLMTSYAAYDRGVLRGIAQYARRYGPWMFFFAGEHREVPFPTSENTWAKPTAKGNRRSRQHPNLLPFDLKGLGATGVIGRLFTPQIVETVLASRLPVIAMDLTDEQLSPDNPLSRVSEIRPDSLKVGRIAADHLLNRGFRHFAFCGYPDENWSRRRQEGFCTRLQEAGFSCDVFHAPQQRPHTSWSHEQPALTKWLRSLEKPSGLLACHDMRGFEVIEACSIGGIHVPNDVAVVGVDEDHLFCEFSNPPLSSVALDAERSGYAAAELLDSMMSRRIKVQERREILVEPLWVVTRASSDVVAIEDQDLARAVAFIRDNARRPLGVQDVVKHSAISRRALEIRFQHGLGRSIREEIQRVHLAWTRQLLVESNMPVSKIVRLTGFSSYSYLHQVFHRAMGVTPAQYRRDHRMP